MRHYNSHDLGFLYPYVLESVWKQETEIMAVGMPHALKCIVFVGVSGGTAVFVADGKKDYCC